MPLARAPNPPRCFQCHCTGVFEPGERGGGVEQKRFSVAESFANRRQHFLCLLDPHDICIKANAAGNDPAAAEPAAGISAVKLIAKVRRKMFVASWDKKLNKPASALPRPSSDP
jgi:hypothetical protein